MISEKTLRLFCDNNESRMALCNPFNIGDYTYATNAQYAIRIQKDPKYEKYEAIPSLADIINISMNGVSEDLLKEIPDIDVNSPRFTCLRCKGTGKTKECPECEGAGDLDITSDYGSIYNVTCKTCNGHSLVSGLGERCGSCNGAGYKLKMVMIDIGTKHINAELLIVVKNLPNVKIATEAVQDLKPIPFTFDGGVGIIMPMRKMSDSRYVTTL